MDIAKIFRDELARRGRTAANVSKEATGQKDAIKRILDGHSPSMDRVEKIAHALGLEFYIGPPREAKSGQTGGGLSTSEDAGEAAPVRDRQLAEVLAIIADHYEQENEYGRQHFIKDDEGALDLAVPGGGGRGLMTAEDTLISSLKKAVISDVVKSSEIPKRTIYNYQNGVPIPLARAEKIAQALGLEFYIGPPRAAKSVKITPQEIFDLLEEKRKKIGLSQAEVSAKVLGNERRDSALFQTLRRGSMPSAGRLQAIAAALDFEFYFGPPREVKSEQITPLKFTSEDAGEDAPGLAPVRDRQLAEVLAIIADHYERENEYGRQYFLADLKTRLPALFSGTRAGPGR